MKQNLFPDKIDTGEIIGSQVGSGIGGIPILSGCDETLSDKGYYVPTILNPRDKPDKSNIHLDPNNFTGEDGRVHIKIR